MAKYALAPGTALTPRQRRKARWLFALALVTHAVLLVVIVAVHAWVLPKRGVIWGRWRYSPAYDGAVTVSVLALIATGFVLGAVSARMRRGLISRWAVILGIEVLIAGVPPIRSRPRELTANRPACAGHLKELGEAVGRYAAGHGGRAPSGWADLLRAEPDLAVSFVCPSSNDDVARGPSTEALLADFARGGRCSYVYRADGAGGVLAHDRWVNHEGAGVHVLYTDGKVRWLAAAEARGVVAGDVSRNGERAK